MTLGNLKLYTLFFCWILFFTGFHNKAIAGKAIDELSFSDFTEEPKTVRIHYRVNETVIEEEYLDNASTLYIIDRLFADNALEEDDFIVIVGRASPEGNYRRNQRLAEQRAMSLKNYIKQNYPKIKNSQIITISGGEDWDGLLMMVEEDKDNPHRDQMLSILRSNKSQETKKSELKKLDKGKAYRYLLKHILPYLRESVTGTIYTKKEKLLALSSLKPDTIEIIRTDTIYIERLFCPPEDVVEAIEPVKEKKPFFIAVKNNLLYDVALLPNLSVEAPFGTEYKWSVAIEGNWSWWNTGAEDYSYHRIQMAGIELRRWFANKTGNPLNGWYIGAYGYGGTYDVRLFADSHNDKGQLSNWSYSGGLTIGYSMPLSRRFNLEFGVGFGYFGGEYHKYNVGDFEECLFPLLSTHKRNYFGPTKAGISLVWLIGSGVNKRKEEAR